MVLRHERPGPHAPVGRIGLAVAVCIGLLLAACSADSEGSPAATSSAVPSVSTAPAAELEWQTVGGGPLPGGEAYLTDVVAREDTVVAIGALPDAQSETATAQMWFSQGGGPWTAATVEGSEGGWPQAVIATDSGFLAVGWTGYPSPLAYASSGSCQTAVWTSADGTTWALEPGPRIDHSALSGVVAWDGGFLAVGGRDLATPGDGSGPRPTDSGATPLPTSDRGGSPNPAGLILRSADGRRSCPAQT